MATKTGLQAPKFAKQLRTSGLAETLEGIARRQYDRVSIDLRQHAGHAVVPRPQRIRADDENGEGYDCAHAWSPKRVRCFDKHLACLSGIVI